MRQPRRRLELFSGGAFAVTALALVLAPLAAYVDIFESYTPFILLRLWVVGFAIYAICLAERAGGFRRLWQIPYVIAGWAFLYVVGLDVETWGAIDVGLAAMIGVSALALRTEPARSTPPGPAPTSQPALVNEPAPVTAEPSIVVEATQGLQATPPLNAPPVARVLPVQAPAQPAPTRIVDPGHATEFVKARLVIPAFGMATNAAAVLAAYRAWLRSRLLVDPDDMTHLGRAIAAAGGQWHRVSDEPYWGHVQFAGAGDLERYTPKGLEPPTRSGFVGRRASR